MLRKIKKALESTREISDWKVIETIKEGHELYFIRQELDMNRAKNVSSYNVTVYHDFEEAGKKFRGSAQTTIHPGMSEGEVKKRIEESTFAAGFVKNRPYPIAEPSEAKGSISSGLQKGEISDWIVEIASEVFSQDIKKGAYLNSTEIYLTKVHTHILNSRGVDVQFDAVRAFIELIVTATGEEEVELYHQLRFSDYRPGSISKKVTEFLEEALNRAQAKPTPALGTAPVLLVSEPAEDFLSYYVDNASARAVYEKISTFKIGESVQGDFVGDGITITLDPFMPESYYSAPYDGDGFALNREQIIVNGKLLKYWGDVRYSHYLGVEPTGNIHNFSVEPGKNTLETLREGPHLEVALFSAFNVDSVTGDFGGEIRLGWYCDGKERYPITGGSISGNINKVQKELLLSKETQKSKRYTGPKAVKLLNVSVSGINK
ncbi:MAG: Zn-dependent protease [Kosmotoga sp.]|uniref:metallopeptidase TldD-related protein n=1 Tax=Kosmotoga sp. TaxID=1955248 RepID=UPI0025BB19D4|nr:metallopeptidase TldD-related protein [Kosmotoga sp.]MCD6159362.1 Zn-dependent protease [Kosmotoga sp.]